MVNRFMHLAGSLFIASIFILAYAQETALHEYAQQQCLDRFDKEKCMGYFQSVIQTQKQLPQEVQSIWEDSLFRKEARYALLKEHLQHAPAFREEWDYAPRNIDVLRAKKLRAIEWEALQEIKETKSAAAGILQAYFLEKKQACATCPEKKKIYAAHVATGVSAAVTALLAHVQRSSYISEEEVALFRSELNQRLAQSRVLQLRLATRIGDAEVADLNSLITTTRAMNEKIALLHTYGQLYSLLLRLEKMHLTWERKALHVFSEYSLDAEAFAEHLEQFADALNKAGEDLADAEERLKKGERKKTVSALAKSHMHLQRAAQEQAFILRLLEKIGHAFSTPYDLIEESIDNDFHGIAQAISSSVPEEVLTARLYPEKGETVVTGFDLRYAFSTLDAEELVLLLSQKLQKSKEDIRRLLRFEVGEK